MEKCVRCKRDMGLGSGVITKVEGDRIYLAHFFCATAAEVRALYGKTSFEFPLKEEKERQR